jgi:hypothetical protein
MRVLSVFTVPALLCAVLTAPGCSSAPGVDGLRESFAAQVASVSFVRDFKASGDELTFSGPFETEQNAQWRIHIDSAVVEPQDDDEQPFKGTIKSSWYVNGRLIEPQGTDSGLPAEFLDKGLGQDCWAFWEKTTKRWGWV